MSISDLKEWVMIGLELIAFIFSLGVIYTRFTNKLNGLGGRVRKLEGDCERRDGTVETLARQVDSMATAQNTVHERLGRVEKAVDSTNEHITEMKLEMAGYFSEMKQMLTQRDALTRERLVRIETINEIERKIGHKIEDFK